MARPRPATRAPTHAEAWALPGETLKRAGKLVVEDAKENSLASRRQKRGSRLSSYNRYEDSPGVQKSTIDFCASGGPDRFYCFHDACVVMPHSRPWNSPCQALFITKFDEFSGEFGEFCMRESRERWRMNRHFSITIRSIFTLFLAFAMSSCLKREYVWVQKVDGLAMKAPIVHTVRIFPNKADQSVSWVESSRDADGRTFNNIRVFKSSKKYSADIYEYCLVVDDDNWESTTELNGALRIKKQMVNGELSEVDWGEERKYKKTFRIK